MGLAYTAPTWENGSGVGISASQLQALSNCMEGLVQGSDKAITDISINNGVMTITFADGSSETGIPANMKGISSIAKTGTSGLVDTYTVTFTDGTTFSYTITNGTQGHDGRDGAIQYTAGTGITISNENVISATADAQVQADWTEADNTKVDYIKNKPNLATVATSGSYGDLSNTPDLDLYYATDDAYLSSDMANGDSIPVHSAQSGETGAKQISYSTFKSNVTDKCFKTNASTETSIADADYMPFDDADGTPSGNLIKKISWSNIKATLKSYFDGIYAAITALGTYESGAIASKAYAVGEHFYKDGKFGTCIQPIAQGATFTLGTNYVEGTVADSLLLYTRDGLIWSNATGSIGTYDLKKFSSYKLINVEIVFNNTTVTPNIVETKTSILIPTDIFKLNNSDKQYYSFEVYIAERNNIKFYVPDDTHIYVTNKPTTASEYWYIRIYGIN